MNGTRKQKKSTYSSNSSILYIWNISFGAKGKERKQRNTLINEISAFYGPELIPRRAVPRKSDTATIGINLVCARRNQGPLSPRAFG